jgi:hypothetical protein
VVLPPTANGRAAKALPYQPRSAPNSVQKNARCPPGEVEPRPDARYTGDILARNSSARRRGMPSRSAGALLQVPFSNLQSRSELGGFATGMKRTGAKFQNLGPNDAQLRLPAEILGTLRARKNSKAQLVSETLCPLEGR